MADSRQSELIVLEDVYRLDILRSYDTRSGAVVVSDQIPALDHDTLYSLSHIADHPMGIDRYAG